MKKPRPTVKSTNDVDGKELLMELEKAANMFAAEAETVKYTYRESQDNKGKLIGSKKHDRQKKKSVGFRDLNVHTQNEKLSKRNRKSCSDAMGTEDSRNKITDSEEEEWLGWDSKISQVHVLPTKKFRHACKDVETLNWNTAVKSCSNARFVKMKGFEAVEQNLHSAEGCLVLREEDCEDCPEYKPSPALVHSNNMMPHPTSDIAKVLQSKKPIKTKKNFQFKFNNFRRQNGSVGTVLSTEKKILKCITQNVGDSWYEVSKELRGVIRPCSVRLSRLSETDLMNSGHILVTSDNRKARSISAGAHRNRQSRMKKSRSAISVKPTVKVPNQVDKTELHLELEKAASTFASEVKPNSYSSFEAEFENTESFVVSKKDKVSKAVSINENCDEKGHMNSTNCDTNVLTNNVVQTNRQKKHTARNNKTVRASQQAQVGNVDSEAEEEDWLGWNSRVTPLDTIPGGEIVSVKENDHVEQLINWNMKVESDSDMDVEEVFLLTDLVEIKKRNVSTDSLSSDSEDEWPGWPEYKPPSTLYYIFKV